MMVSSNRDHSLFLVKAPSHNLSPLPFRLVDKGVEYIIEK